VKIVNFKGRTSLLAFAFLSACAASSVTQVSSNQFIISTSAAPVCGGVGAQKVAAKMAAVEVLRHGFERYIIVGADAANNTGIMRTGPTYSNTSATFNRYGNTVYGRGTTYYGGQQTIVYGSHDAKLAVIAINKGDDGFNDAVDAKLTIGEDWERIVKNGVHSCN